VAPRTATIDARGTGPDGGARNEARTRDQQSMAKAEHSKTTARQARQPLTTSNGTPAIQLPRVRKRRSRLHGIGVFALEDIPKNKRIIVYAGERITTRESSKREARYLRNGHIWCFRVNRRWAVDGAVDGNDARYINHSCTPNCYSQIIDGVIWIRAGKSIAAGEELTYNDYTEGTGHIQCRCRPGCGSRL
jgi:uncharacterized protein